MTAPRLPSPGDPLDALDTPCLLLDLDVFESNIQTMSRFLGARGVAWRPHAKCYKSTKLARAVLDSGAIGLTCAKLGEAEVFAAAGITDLLIANPLVGQKKLDRLVALGEIADPIAIVDGREHVQALSAAASAAGVTLRTMIEVDIGMERCGVRPGEPARRLAELIAGAAGLELAGIMGYEGHLLRLPNPAEKGRRIAAAIRELVATRDAIEAAGLRCGIVSAGGTGSYHYTAGLEGVTEIQAGGGVFMDLMYRELCGVEDLDFALTILATVTSRPAPDRAIIDAGRKAMHPDLHLPVVSERGDLRVRSLSAEHGILEVIEGAGPALGERLRLLPGYCDLTTVLHDRILCVRGGALEAIWPLEARGRLE